MDYNLLKKTLINNIEPIKLIYDFIEVINKDFNLYKNEYVYNECKNKIDMIKNKVDGMISNIITNIINNQDKKYIILSLSDKNKKDIDIYYKQLKTIQNLLTNMNKT